MDKNNLSDLVSQIDFEFSRIDRIYNSKKKKIINRWTLLLPSAGCSWARKSGGCFMCGFTPAILGITNGKMFSKDEILKVFKIGYENVKSNQPEELAVYNGGSFLNPGEISLDSEVGICKEIRNNSTIDLLSIESRPEFIAHENIKFLVSELGDKKLRVGIGLECENDEIRERCINKGFSRKDYEGAVRILKDNNADVKTYVFIKPLYLSEREAIDEAVKTAEYAHSVGSDEIAFEAALVQRCTKMEDEYNKGNYRPPWLWSILEVLKRTSQVRNVKISLGDFNDIPLPIALPHNCYKCDLEFKKLFEIYRISNNVMIFNKINCACREEWEKELTEND